MVIVILAPFAYVVLVGGAVGMLAWVSDYKPDTPCPAERTAKPVTENTMSEDAALYAGPGPHPIVLVEPGIDRVWIRDPTDLSASLDSWRAPDGAGLQLVACHYVHDIGYAPTVNCRYRVGNEPEPRTVPLPSARHHYRLFEAATGSEVAAFDVPKESECPEVTGVSTTGGDDTMTTPINTAQLIAGRRPYVEAAR